MHGVLVQLSDTSAGELIEPNKFHVILFLSHLMSVSMLCIFSRTCDYSLLLIGFAFTHIEAHLFGTLGLFKLPVIIYPLLNHFEPKNIPFSFSGIPNCKPFRPEIFYLFTLLGVRYKL